MKHSFIIIGSIIMLSIASTYVYFSFFATEPKYIDPSSTLEEVSIQPRKAIEIAEPYLEEHATVIFKDDEPLKTHIVSYKNWYYIMRTNYPTKTFRYYMQPAVKVNMSTGAVEFSKEN